MAVTIETIDLDMSDEQDEVISKDNEKVAEARKEMGNSHYKKKKYSLALKCYKEAVDLCPDNSSYYGNRSACYMMLGLYNNALEDAIKSVTLDPRFVKGWIRACKCYIVLGQIDKAECALQKVKELDPANSAIQSEKSTLDNLKAIIEDAQKTYEKGDFRKVVYCVDRALDVAKNSSELKVLKAECLAYLGRYQESQELANDVLSSDKQNVSAILTRGICLYYQDNFDKAFSHFQHVLKLAPDHKKALQMYKKAKALKQKKEEGNVAFKAGNNEAAYSLYSDALTVDPDNKSTNAKLYFNRATVCSKLGRLNEAVSDCTSALELDPSYLKALLRRAKCHLDLSNYDEAVADYEKAYKMDKSRETKDLLYHAKKELKKSKRKDYYKILGVEKNATPEDITKAYRKRALVHHPDRHVNATEDEKKEQEMKFKEVGEAYGVLSDPNKKMRYDNGQDDSMDMDMDDPDHHMMFQRFFFGSANHAFFPAGPGCPQFSFG